MPISPTTTTEESREAPRRRGASASRSLWLPDQKAAEAAYNNCFHISQTTVDAYDHFDQSARNLAKAVYDLILSLMPEEVLVNLRRKYGERSDEETEAMPRNVLAFLSKYGLPRPPLHSTNPFLGFFQAFWTQSARQRKTMTVDEAIQASKDAIDIAKLRAEKAAENTMVSRYAKLIMVAVDMNDVKMLDKPFRVAFDEHATFIKHHDTLVGKPPTTRGRKPKTPVTPDDTTSTSTSSRSDETAEFEAGVAGYDPLRDPAMTKGTTDTDDKTEDKTPKVPDSAAEKQLDADLRERTTAAAKGETQPVEQPAEQSKDEPASEATAAVTGVSSAPSSTVTFDQTPTEPLQLSTPVDVKGVIEKILRSSSREELAKEMGIDQELHLEVDGTIRLINHRKVIEPVTLDNKELVAASSQEGLLRYRRDGDTIIILETLAWD